MAAMRSFNVLTPHYEEGVIYSLKAFDTARMLGLEKEDSALVRCRPVLGQG